jgi:hypothetical protein
MTEEVEDCPLQSFDVNVDSDSDGILLVRGIEAFELDAVGASIWQLCDGTRSVHAIAKAITVEYEVDQQTAQQDVAQLVAELRSTGLLE